LLLKTLCDGKIECTPGLIKSLAKTLGYKTKAPIDKCFNYLIKRNWVGYDNRSDICFVRSFDYLSRIENWHHRKAIKCTLPHILNFKAFLGGALFAYFYKNKKWKLSRNGLTKKSPRQFRKGSTFYLFPFNEINNRIILEGGWRYYQVSSGGIADLLGVSRGKIDRLKKLAVNQGYLTVLPVYSDFHSVLKNNYTMKDLRYIKEFADFPYRNQLYLSQGRIRMREVDGVLPHIALSTRRKVKG